MPSVFQTEQWVAAPLRQVFWLFCDLRHLPAISPPSAGVRVESLRLASPPVRLGLQPGGLAGAGTEIEISFRLFPHLPLRCRWTARIVEFEWDRYFRDIQVSGPFKQFDHTHQFETAAREGREGTLIRDIVQYDLGYGPLGWALDATLVRLQLAAMFRHRQRATAKLLAAAP